MNSDYSAAARPGIREGGGREGRPPNRERSVWSADQPFTGIGVTSEPPEKTPVASVTFQLWTSIFLVLCFHFPPSLPLLLPIKVGEGCPWSASNDALTPYSLRARKAPFLANQLTRRSSDYVSFITDV